MTDSIDLHLLELLQKDATLTAHELGERLGLSQSQAGRRRQKLETDGLIRCYAAKLDAHQLGLTVQAFIQVQIAQHGEQHAKSFARLVATRPEIVSAFTLTGEADYLLRVYCADLAGLNVLIHEVLLAASTLARVTSQIVMDQIKQDAPLPL